MRHAWARTDKPKLRECARCGASERQRKGPGGAWRREYALRGFTGDSEWSFVTPSCAGDPAVVAKKVRSEVVVQERPYLVGAEDVAKLLALPDREAVLAEVEAGRLEKPVAGERWVESDLKTYVATLVSQREPREDERR